MHGTCWQVGKLGGPAACYTGRQEDRLAEQCGTLWHVPLFCSLWEKQASVRKICEGGRPDDTASWGQPVMFRGVGKLRPRRYIACARYGTRSCPPAGAPGGKWWGVALTASLRAPLQKGSKRRKCCCVPPGLQEPPGEQAASCKLGPRQHKRFEVRTCAATGRRSRQCLQGSSRVRVRGLRRRPSQKRRRGGEVCA